MSNEKEGGVVTVDVATVHAWLDADQAVLVDVRETSEFDQEHIPGALLLPMSVFDAELFPTVPGKKVVLHCAVGKRSEAAGKMLLREGHKEVIHMAGGLVAWKEAGFPTEVQLVAHPGPQDIAPKAPVPVEKPLCPPPGEVLVEEFLKPLGLDVGELAAAIGVPPAEVKAVMDAAAPVTAELSLRLARYFSTAGDFWLNVQMEHDLEKARRAVGEKIRREIRPRTAGG